MGVAILAFRGGPGVGTRTGVRLLIAGTPGPRAGAWTPGSRAGTGTPGPRSGAGTPRSRAGTPGSRAWAGTPGSRAGAGTPGSRVWAGTLGSRAEAGMGFTSGNIKERRGNVVKLISVFIKYMLCKT